MSRIFRPYCKVSLVCYGLNERPKYRVGVLNAFGSVDMDLTPRQARAMAAQLKQTADYIDNLKAEKKAAKEKQP